MKKGRVKFFDKKKGFGFIKVKNLKNDIHFGFDSFKGFIPEKGDLVEFEVEHQQRGSHALNMQLIKNSKKVSHPSFTLPRDTRKIVKKNIKSFENVNLMYQKYIKVNEKNQFEKPNLKSRTFKYLDHFKRKFEKNLKQKATNIKFIGFTGKTASRLLVGLGNPSVFETSLKLNHIYGFPYIPGSAIKGILRNYLINEYFKDSYGNGDENLALQDKGFCNIFGCPKESFYNKEHQGKIFFLDSIPNERPEIEKDVMTPHYGEYYKSEGKKPPADYYSPNIIDFLGVARNIEFNFYIGIKKKDKEIKILQNSELVDDDTPLLDYVEKKLIKALEFQGVGAKTAVGYGYFYDFMKIDMSV